MIDIENFAALKNCDETKFSCIMEYLGLNNETDLSYNDFSYCDFSNQIFVNINFEHTYFTKANLSNSVFINCNFDQCNFSLADISHSEFNNSSIETAITKNCIQNKTIHRLTTDSHSISKIIQSAESSMWSKKNDAPEEEYDLVKSMELIRTAMRRAKIFKKPTIPSEIKARTALRYILTRGQKRRRSKINILRNAKKTVNDKS